MEKTLYPLQEKAVTDLSEKVLPLIEGQNEICGFAINPGLGKGFIFQELSKNLLEKDNNLHIVWIAAFVRELDIDPSRLNIYTVQQLKKNLDSLKELSKTRKMLFIVDEVAAENEMRYRLINDMIKDISNCRIISSAKSNLDFLSDDKKIVVETDLNNAWRRLNLESK